MPSPARSLAELVLLIGDQRRFLAATENEDRGVARAALADAPFGSSLWQRSAATRILITLAERSGRDLRREWWLDPKHELADLLRAIVLRARQRTEAAHARFRLIILPDRDDLDWRREHSVRYWDPWLGQLTEGGVDWVDLAAELDVHGDDPTLWARDGHYSARANQIVADELTRLLER